MFLIAVDAHSKWPDVIIMKETTANKTIVALRNMFASFAIPEQLVTDNGPQFVSEEFAQFVKLNGIKHIRCAPYHPASDGLSERFVQSLKIALKANIVSGLTLEHRLSNFLLSYRSTPNATTGVLPASLFLHRSIRTRLDLLHPTVESQVLLNKQIRKFIGPKNVHFS
jgi:transposase InsO family protein